MPHSLAKITENAKNWAESQKTCHYFVIHSWNIWGFRFVRKNGICLEDKLPCTCGGLSRLVCDTSVPSSAFGIHGKGPTSSTNAKHSQSPARAEAPGKTPPAAFSFLSPFILFENVQRGRGFGIRLSPASLGLVYSGNEHSRRALLWSSLLNGLKHPVDTSQVPVTGFFFKKNHCFGTHKAPSDLREEVNKDKKKKGGKSKIL